MDPLTVLLLLAVVACPLLMVWMHGRGGHGEHGGHGAQGQGVHGGHGGHGAHDHGAHDHGAPGGTGCEGPTLAELRRQRDELDDEIRALEEAEREAEATAPAAP